MGLERRKNSDSLDGSMGAGGLRESAGMEVYAGSDVETAPLEFLTVVL